MKRRTKRDILDVWIDRNGPNGLERLAIETGVSYSLISKARATGDAPKKASTRLAIANFLNVTEDELFPLVSSKGRKAAS